MLGNLLPRLQFFTKVFNAKITDVFIDATTEMKSTDLALSNKTNFLDSVGAFPLVSKEMNLFGLDGLTITFTT